MGFKKPNLDELTTEPPTDSSTTVSGVPAREAYEDYDQADILNLKRKV